MPEKTLNQSARVTLRQLCNLEVPGSLLLPSLLAALRVIVPADHGAFFYCDHQGNMVNMYAEKMLPPESMNLYYERFYRNDSSAFSKTFLSLAASSDSVSSRSLSPEEKKADYYKEILSSLGVEHILYGIVRLNDSTREPIGQLSLYRNASSAAFSATDATALREVLKYLGKALKVSPFAQSFHPEEKPVEEAMAIFSLSGSQIFADENWLRLVRLAKGEPISPKTAKVELVAIQEFIKSMVSLAASSKKSAYVVDSPWGRFAFRHHGLTGEPEQKAIALIVSRLAVGKVLYAEGAAKLGLSSQQREVALMVSLGKTNAQIASQLGVSLNTAGYHVKQLFTKLGVHERSSVAERLRSA